MFQREPISIHLSYRCRSVSPTSRGPSNTGGIWIYCAYLHMLDEFNDSSLDTMGGKEAWECPGRT